MHQVPKVVHLKLIWVFLNSLAWLMYSCVFGGLIQITAEDVYVHVKSLQQKHIPWRKLRQKDK